MFATWDSYILRRGHPDMLGFVQYDDFYAYPESGDPSMPNVDRLISIQSAFEELVSSLKVAELKLLLRPHGLPVSGRKEELVRRLWNRRQREDT